MAPPPNANADDVANGVWVRVPLAPAAAAATRQHAEAAIDLFQRGRELGALVTDLIARVQGAAAAIDRDVKRARRALRRGR